MAARPEHRPGVLQSVPGGTAPSGLPSLSRAASLSGAVFQQLQTTISYTRSQSAWFTMPVQISPHLRFFTFECIARVAAVLRSDGYRPAPSTVFRSAASYAPIRPTGCCVHHQPGLGTRMGPSTLRAVESSVVVEQQTQSQPTTERRPDQSTSTAFGGTLSDIRIPAVRQHIPPALCSLHRYGYVMPTSARGRRETSRMAHYSSAC